ncbi:MAG: type II secretion system F family protein [Lachnospiraceae bacterium]|nr:type II secretion system F family protein [Lachnospiraceae bacterium]
MPNFGYTAIDKSGVEVKGSINAEDKEKVKREVKAMGMIPLEIVEQSVWTQDIDLSFERKPSARDLSVFCRQFVSMTKAGVSIIEAMKMLTEQTENKALRNAVEGVRVNLEKGESLASSMRQYPKIFPNLLINMVAAGEASGSLDHAMDRMSVQFEKTAKNQGLMKKAMIYPIIVGLVALGVIVVMLLVVIPSYAEMFETLDATLPAITVLVMAMSQFLQRNWLFLLLLVVLVVLVTKAYLTTENGKHVWAEIQFRIPIVKNLVVKTASANMARTIGTMVSTGIPLVEAVDIVADTMDNVLVKESLIEAKEQIMMGVPLSEPIKESGIFPPMVHHMMKIGEEAGTTEEMLTKLADYYDEEVELAVQALMAAIEPLVIIVLALIVGFLVLSVILPMMSMYDALNTL